MAKQDDVTRGIAMLAVSFGVSLVGLLQKKGIVSPAEVDAFFGTVLSTLGRYASLDDPAIEEARKVLDGLAQNVVGTEKK